VGKEAAAGLHAVLLRERGFVENDAIFLCPGSTLKWTGENGEFRLPTRAQVRTATGAALESLRRSMGGAYGYNLGYFEDGSYKAVRNRNRGTFALVADAPNLTLPTAQSANHRGRGQNVLFEDGHVSFLVTPQVLTSDDFYHNDDGQVAAGKHPDDAVIGPSEVSPLGWEAVE
jgi:hypothetical protein